MHVVEFRCDGSVVDVDVSSSWFQHAAPQPCHSPVMMVEHQPPASVAAMRPRVTLSFPPSLCDVLLCAPVYIARAGGDALSVHEWRGLLEEAEAFRTRQVLLHTRAVVPLCARAAPVLDDVVKRAKRVSVPSRRVKVKEGEESEDELVDDAVLQLSSSESEEEEVDVAGEDDEDVVADDDACDSAECEEEEEEESGEEECEEDDECLSDGADAVVAPPPKKLRALA